MTITVKCQYTGIEFEANSRRQKNHPQVSRLLDEAAKDKHNPAAYRNAINALREAREAGLTDIDAIIAYARRVMAGQAEIDRSLRDEQARAERERQREREEAKRRRRAQNDFLYRHGYRWSKEYADQAEYEGEFEASQWQLWSPDGRPVSVEQALDEIERGVEVVLAEIAQREAEEQADRQRQEEAEQRQQAERDAAFERAAAIGAEVEPFDLEADFDSMEYLYHVEEHHPATHIEWVRRGLVNGVECAVTYVLWAADDAEQMRFYCANPAAAGLTPVVQKSSALDEFWG